MLVTGTLTQRTWFCDSMVEGWGTNRCCCLLSDFLLEMRVFYFKI